MAGVIARENLSRILQDWVEAMSQPPRRLLLRRTPGSAGKRGRRMIAP